MKYNIQINQFILSKTKLDLKDCAILDYLKSFCGIDDKNVKQLEITENGVRYKYTWINFGHLIKEMPLLKLKGKASISERIHKIEKEGFIKTFIAPDRSLYVRLNEKIKEIDFTDDFTKGVRQDERRCSAGRTGCSAGRTGGVRLDEQHKHNINSNIISVNNNNPATDLQSQAIAVLSTSSDSNMGTEINELIKEFEPINPSFRRLYPNKTQRAALERLVQQHGKMKIEELIRILPQTNQMKYLPTITTPLQLEEKLGQLIAGIKKVKLNKPTVAKIK